MNTPAIKTLRLGSILISLRFDSDATSPRRAQDCFGHILFPHREYCLSDPGEEHTFPTLEYFKRWRRSNRRVIALPLILFRLGYQMPQLRIAQSNQEAEGWLYVTAKEFRKAFGLGVQAREYAERLLNAELEEYNSYLAGDVYGYTVHKLNSDGQDVKCLDSCWGYVGEVDYCWDEAFASGWYELHCLTWNGTLKDLECEWEGKEGC